MQAQQKQALSWSDFYSEVVANAHGAQKALIKSKANEIYSFYKSGKAPQEVINYVLGGCL